MPFDAARKILRDMAAAVAPVALPMVELWPTGELVSNGNSVANATTSGAIQVQFPCDGYVVGIAATTRDAAAASMGGMLLRVVVDGNTDLFTTGAAGGYKPFAQISGVGAVGAVSGYWKCRIPFRQATAWQIYLNNTTATNPLVADIGFALVNVSQPKG
jgi:hypothetical protein